MMNIDVMNIVYAVLVLGCLGALFGLVLAISSRVFAVQVDERCEKIQEILPGANCGGCGFAGCAMYAKAISSQGAAVNHCSPGGQEVADKVAAVMGIQTTKNIRMVALVKCSGGVNASKKYEYEGISDCLSASLLPGSGDAACSYGCLGFGSCVNACPFGAISVVDGCAKVDHEKCTGCMNCAKACPRGVIVPVSYTADVVVACSSHEKGASLRKICNIGCIGCSLCQKNCPADAIHIVDNLAVIDYEKCQDCGKCATICPRHLISDSNLPNKAIIEAMDAAAAQKV